MKLFITRNKSYLLLLLIFFVSELIVNPIGDFPLNDDWTYGKSVLVYKNDGKIDIGDFAAMSLFSHIMWGFLFTKVFWFSFSILRFSTLISSFIGITFFYKLILRITEHRNVAFFGALILLFNPLYFNLTNTFMTDVNFNTLLILSCYFAYDFFKTQNLISLIVVFIFSLLLVLLRQFGIIVPVCFTVATLFIKEKKWRYAGMSFVLTLLVYGVFKYYESYLKAHLGPNSAYKFSSDSDITSFVFWDTYWYNLKLRYSQILLHLLIYSSPFALVYIKQFVKKINILITLCVIALSSYAVYILMKDVPFPIGNIFTNRALGAETFFESLFPELKALHEHTFSPNFETLAALVKYCLCTVSVTVLSLSLIAGIRQKTNPLKAKPEFLFFLGILFTYVSMILITESYFDRYHIPIITIFILLLSFLPDTSNLTFSGSIVILLVMFYVSVFGTKDYLELNRKRWEAYAFLKEAKKVDPTKINGGFEVNCWNEGKRSWWYDFFSLNNYDYLIQYRQEANFKIYKEYEFQRYFPYKKDKVYIFSRDTIKP